MTRVLVTGFEPFGAHEVNPSALIAEAFDGVVLCAAPGLPFRARLFGAGALAFGSYLIYISRLLADQRDTVDIA